MARGPLGLSEEEFWEAYPRKIVAMTREWRTRQIHIAKINFFVERGVELEEPTAYEAQAQEVDARFL